jgi:tetratricopeptide (TPR) repeat protein
MNQKQGTNPDRGEGGGSDQLTIAPLNLDGVWREIEKAIEKEDWNAAGLLIQSELEKDSLDHWLLTRLALTYYEQFDYQRALELSGQALELEPECPLALWDYAGALAMLDRPEEAITFYQRIIDRGIDSLAHDQCGEGRARQRVLRGQSLPHEPLLPRSRRHRKSRRDDETASSRTWAWMSVHLPHRDCSEGSARPQSLRARRKCHEAG